MCIFSHTTRMIRIIFPWPSTEFPDQINPRTFQVSGNPGFSMLSLKYSKCPIILFRCKSVLPQCHMTCLYMCSVAFIWSHNCRWYVKSGLPRSFCSWVMARQTDRQRDSMQCTMRAPAGRVAYELVQVLLCEHHRWLGCRATKWIVTTVRQPRWYAFRRLLLSINIAITF